MELPICFCGAPARMKESKHGCFWTCTRWPNCDGLVGCHPGTSKPLGTLGNSETRRLRHELHQAFDPLWKCLMGRPIGTSWRGVAYRWLGVLVGRPGESVHIGQMDEAEARRVLALIQDKGPTDLLAFLKWELEEEAS